MWKSLQALMGTAVLLAVALLAVVAPSEAQVPQEQERPQHEEPAHEISEEELEEFAEVYIEVDAVRENLEEQVAEAQTPQEAEQMQATADQAALQIVEEHGMTVERYTDIAEAVHIDPELNARFQEILEEKQGLADDDRPGERTDRPGGGGAR